MRTIFILIFFVAASTAFGQNPYPVAQSDAENTPNGESTNNNPDEFYLVHYINYTGNKKTKPEIVEREIAVRSGISYSKDELAHQLRTTREQLMNTALFVDVIVDTFMVDSNELDVNITLKERWYVWPTPYFKVVDRNWNVWIKEYGASLDRADLGLKVTHHNVSGNMDKLNLWIIGGYTQRVSFNYFQPYFDKKLRFGYNFGFAYSRNREVNYATDSNKQKFLEMPNFGRKYIKGEVGLSYRQGSALRMQFRPSLNFEQVDSQIIKLNPNYLGNNKTKSVYIDLLYGFQYYKVDYIPYPLRGWYVDASLLGRISDNDPMQMLQVNAKFIGTWSIMPKTYLAFQAAGLVRLPRSNSYFNSRLLGYGDNYMQGLEYYVADGTAGGMFRTTLRYNFLNLVWHNNLFRSKTHNEIPFRFFVKGFGNIGYVYSKNPGNSFMNNRLLTTAGFGIDIVSIYDWAIKFDFTFNQFDKGGKLYLHTQSDF